MGLALAVTAPIPSVVTGATAYLPMRSNPGMARCAVSRKRIPSAFVSAKRGIAVSGLRELQKEQRRRAITRAAMDLFTRQGYQQTTIEQIARTANVSAPTVFNYFGTKQEIILEALKSADQGALLQIRQQVAGMTEPVEILCTMERIITEFVMGALPASLWVELLPLVITGTGEGLPAGYKVLNDALVKELWQVFEQLRGAGLMRGDADVEMAVSLINDYSHLLLLRLCQASEPDWEAHSRLIRRLMSMIFNGLKES
ncbi:TetR/AcrR family transcriptional regulator [Pseudomonas monteilii]|uniref:TetR/AcrR family transcriptional regulator n=1 Tax=Pseudomonas monteilii TaxID=76759 RepID=UPI00383B6EA4